MGQKKNGLVLPDLVVDFRKKSILEMCSLSSCGYWWGGGGGREDDSDNGSGKDGGPDW